MTINFYSYTDASAPLMRGVVGDLTTLLDAILVNGYGSKSGAGWAIAYTGTNQRVYRPASGNRFYLAIDDTNPAPLSAGAGMGRAASYETMSAVTTGTKQIPTAAQWAALGLTGPSPGSLVCKSSSNDTVQRPWIAYVSDTFVHLFIGVSNAVTAGWGGIFATYVGGLMWGDLVNQQKVGDAYATILIAGTSVSYSNCFAGGLCASAAGATLTAHWMQRAYHQNNAGILCAKNPIMRGLGGVTQIGSDGGTPNFPDPITGGFELAEIWVYEQTNGLSGWSARGRIPGLYSPLHNLASMSAYFNVGDAIAGAGTYAGTNFQIVAPGSSSLGLMQTNGTW